MIYLLENPEGAGERALARMLLSYGLFREYGVKGETAVETAPLGKPYLPEYPGIYFNYSHCRRGILCGISDGEIGVDIEEIIPYKEKLARRICHPEELRMLSEAEDKNRMLTAIWTAKESYLKYMGTGIRSDLRLLDLSAALEQGAIPGDVFLHSRMEKDYGMCICSRDSRIRLQRVFLRRDAQGREEICGE